MVAAGEKSGDVSVSHLLRTMYLDVCVRFHGNPSHSC